MASHPITLSVAEPGDLPAFKKELQDAFAVAVVEAFGPLPNGPIPSDRDLDEVIATPHAVALRVLSDGRPVGGAVVRVDPETNHNALDLFFMVLGTHGRGLGHAAWCAIERMFPETRVWQTHTPYFEKRNIHFYVNKCGFKIVEFFGPHHVDLHGHGPDDLPGGGEGFRFEKIMPDRDRS